MFRPKFLTMISSPGVRLSVYANCLAGNGIDMRRISVGSMTNALFTGRRAVQTMNNSVRQSAIVKAGLGDLHVHDLQHTVGLRLRECGVPESTNSAILWHSNKSMTAHYSMAQSSRFSRLWRKSSTRACEGGECF